MYPSISVVGLAVAKETISEPNIPPDSAIPKAAHPVAMVAKAKWNLASFSSLSLSPPVIFQKVAIPFVGSAVVGRNMEWSYEEALSVTRSQVVKGCLSMLEVAEKNDEAAGAKSKSKAVEAARIWTPWH